MSIELTEPQLAFLNAYRATGRVQAAAELLGISCDTHYHAFRDSETYRRGGTDDGVRATGYAGYASADGRAC